VFVHDAVDYMATEADLGRAMETAFVQCRPGGVAVFVPDRTTETFEPETDHGGTDAEDGRGVRFLDWSWDPVPDDGWAVTEYAFLLRDADGFVRVAHESHRLGLFGRQVWLRLLREAGFEPSAVAEETTEDPTPRELFIGRRPAPWGRGEDDHRVWFRSVRKVTGTPPTLHGPARLVRSDGRA